MFHCTERLLLRPPWQEDWQGVFAGIANRDVIRNLALAPWPYAPEDAQRWVALPQDPFHPRFLVCEASSGAIVGCMGIHPRDGAVEIGYWIAPSHQGRGYATEAARGVLEVARMLGHRTIRAEHFIDNPASGRVLRKVGFRPTGRVEARTSLGRATPSDCAVYEKALDEEDAVAMRAA
ncbi:MAG: GNAT family N-acetyltransferase [Sphingomonadaceae bacterium]|nr:GNAT family N-acetyltransferase [Sphingomonadaceae bacterium]